MAGEQQVLTPETAAAVFEEQMDDNGFLPGDEDYEGPEPVEETEDDAAEPTEPDESAEGGDNESEEEEEGNEEEAEGEEPEEESEESPGLDEEKTLIDIDIDGETYEVNLVELKSGYLRQEEYTKRLAEIDTKRAEVEEQLSQREVDLNRELELAQVMITGDLRKYDQVDWNRLKTEDPAQYQALRLEAVEAKERVDAIAGRRAQIDAMRAKAEQLKHEAYVKRQIEIAEKLIPDFRTEEFRKTIVKYGESVGYTEGEILGMSDARQLLLLNQARLYSEGQVRRKEALEKKVPENLPPVVKSGAPKAKNSDAKTKAKATGRRFAEEKSVEAAAAHFMNIVDLD
uniref:Scaffolding protein n=3 Tax=unclassified bacterial viruses TaxID=12333 RepID=A0AAU6VZK1_9VIRU